MRLDKAESMTSSSGINIDHTITHIEEAIIFGLEIEELKEKIVNLERRLAKFEKSQKSKKQKKIHGKKRRHHDIV